MTTPREALASRNFFDDEADAILIALAPWLIPEGCVAACSVCYKRKNDWPSDPHNNGKCNSFERVELGQECPLEAKETT
jgi:hypothetical protein